MLEPFTEKETEEKRYVRESKMRGIKKKRLCELYEEGKREI